MGGVINHTGGLYQPGAAAFAGQGCVPLAAASTSHPNIDFTSIVTFTTTLLASSTPNLEPTSDKFKVSAIATLAHLPDVMATPLQGKKLSIEPVYLTELYRQVEDQNVQILLLQICAQAAPHYTNVLNLCERWAAVVPLTTAFLRPICELSNSIMSGEGERTAGAKRQQKHHTTISSYHIFL